MVNQKQSKKEKLQEITAGIERGIKELFESDKYANYLRTMSRFPSYSTNNIILIHMQMPHASLVAGYSKWKNQFGRHVKKGAQSIKIIAPTPFEKKVEKIKRDPDTKAPILDQDGKAILEEKEIQIPMFKVVSVFDVSQTEGKPLPQIASDLKGDVQNYEIFMEALRRSSPVPLQVAPIRDNADGFFNADTQSITIREGMSEVQTVSAAVHEITHAKLHNYEKGCLTAAKEGETKDPPKPKDRRTEEVEAESVSYSVCQYYGIETGANSFGYIVSWSKGKELPELKASLDTINRTARSLIHDIDTHFAKICKERGIGLDVQSEQTVQEQEGHFDREDSVRKDTLLDQYPMPDAGRNPEEPGTGRGYLDEDMLPLSKDRAMELLEQDFTIYAVGGGGSAEMVFDREDLEERPAGVMFTVPREEWEQSKEFDKQVQDRLNRQEEREAAFLEHSGDCFAIYQVKDEDSQGVRFMGMDWLESKGLAVERANYDLIYTGQLSVDNDGGPARQLESLYEQFNIRHPADYHSPSLSVSDIIAVKQNGMLSCHYCDSFGFRELTGFLERENPLKNAELQVKNDYGMTDGLISNDPKEPTVAEMERQALSGQSISLMTLAEAIHRENREKKKSVVEQLKNQPRQEHKKAAPKRSAEREI